MTKGGAIFQRKINWQHENEKKFQKRKNKKEANPKIKRKVKNIFQKNL